MDWLACGAIAAAILITCVFIAGQHSVMHNTEVPAYAVQLFDDSYVHTMHIHIQELNVFLSDAGEEEYVAADVEIDGEMVEQVGLRTKGNNSLRLTQEYGLSRFSLKLEFDHYTKGGNYQGLDKLSLDASFQDNSYMKTWLAYDMMHFLEVPAPLCSYVFVTINDKPWGLYLAVEEAEEAFARRNFGSDHGKLYKPDYRSLKDDNKDVALQYIDDEPKSYPGIFEQAKIPVSDSDKMHVIEALKKLNAKEDLEEVIDTDEVIRYFAAHAMTLNWDSYAGYTGHNYLLYEEEGKLSILPWDYNLAFGTYALGMSNPIKDPNVLINYPIDTPCVGTIMRERPLYHHVMQVDACFQQYYAYLDKLVADYVENEQYLVEMERMREMIHPYIKEDPTAFCSVEDFEKAADTLQEVVRLRGMSIRGQLNGEYPSSLREQETNRSGVDASHVKLETLGDFEDLENAQNNSQKR